MGDAALDEQTVPDETGESTNELDKALEELNGLGDPALSDGAAAGASGMTKGNAPDNFILDIPIDVHIVIGSAELSVARLMDLSEGEMITLNRRVGEPVDVMVNGRNIAKGEITVLENDETRFGLKITELTGRQN